MAVPLLDRSSVLHSHPYRALSGVNGRALVVSATCVTANYAAARAIAIGSLAFDFVGGFLRGLPSNHGSRPYVGYRRRILFAPDTNYAPP